MKKISINVYSYDELSKTAQSNAQIEWENTNPTDYLIEDFQKFLAELKDIGIVLHSWSFDYCEFHYSFYTNSDLTVYDIEGLSAFKKILSLYYQLNLVPKIYKSKTKQRISKIQQVPDDTHDWMYYAFVESLKEVIQQKSSKYNLTVYLEEALDLTLKEIQREYRAILDSFPTVAADYEYYFYEDGSRCYEAEEI